MKRFMMKSVILAMAMGLMLTACSKDDDNGTQEENAADVAKVLEQVQADAMYNQLCMPDTTKVPTTLVSRIGKVLYTVMPTIYYTIANSVEEARDRYESIVAVASNDSIVISPLPDDVKRGDVHVSFAASSAPGEVARITVDCPRLKDVVTSIVFMTDEAWPENDLASPFNFLSLWQYVPNGNYYLTVRDSKGGMGLMLTFDSGWTVHEVLNEGGGKWNIYDNENLACLDCFKSLSSCMLYYPDKFKAMLDNFAQKGGTNSKTYKVLKYLFEDKAPVMEGSTMRIYPRAPQNERRFLYHNAYKTSGNGTHTVGVWYAAFDERKLSLQKYDYSMMQLMIATWPRGELAHNAWFYSNYQRDEKVFKAIQR